MADPQLYTVSYSFGGFQASNPSTSLPATPLDNELADIAAAVAALVNAVKDVRRSDGALKNKIVTFDSLEDGIQFLLDPTNGQLVAAAVASAQAAQAAVAGSATAAGTSATNAAASAAAAAASANSVNFSLFLSKAGNLAGLGSVVTSRANLGLGTAAVLDVGTAPGQIVQLDGSSKLPGVDGSQLTNVDVLPVGALIWMTGVSAPAGTVKANGALLSRTTYPRLWNFAASGTTNNIVSEAVWSAVNSGSYSTGDLTTTFRVPDVRAEFIRAYDDGRGIDARNLGQRQADMLKDHTHPYTGYDGGSLNAGGGFGGAVSSNTTGGVNAPNNGGTETRPRNLAYLGCIKY